MAGIDGLQLLSEVKNNHFSEDYKTHIEILETNLSEICSPFLKNLSLQHAHITSMEVQVANLIKAGKKNKDCWRRSRREPKWPAESVPPQCLGVGMRQCLLNKDKRGQGGGRNTLQHRHAILS